MTTRVVTIWGASAVIFAAVGLVASGVWLWTTVTPSENLARLRNAIGAEIGKHNDFDWQPSIPPGDFLVGRKSIPPRFSDIADLLASHDAVPGLSDLGFSIAIARHLMSAEQRVGSPIRSTVETTHESIVRDGRGYCADFVKVFTGISLARGVDVRQWGFAFDGFGSGHTFNEIYDSYLRQWVLIDSFHSLYFVDRLSRRPLSTLEVHDRLLELDGTSHDVEIVRIVPERFPFRSDALALDYYRRGMAQLWLVWGANPFDYEASVAGALERKTHRAIGQFIGIMSGDYPTIKIYPVGMSQRDYKLMVETRNEFMLAASFFIIQLFLAICLFFVMVLRRKDTSRAKVLQ